MYTTPLGPITREEDTNGHFYADDTQLYLLFEIPRLGEAIGQMENTVSSVQSWMNNNMLKLNTNKTEMLVVSSKKQLDALAGTTLQIGGDTISASPSVRNIGAIMDTTLSMVPQISNVARIANFHLRNIGRVRKFLTTEATEQLVHSLVSSRIDYANALLANTPKCELRKLELVFNTAARIITRTPKVAHITPVLQSLHWLPISERIDYKIALLTFKALHDMSPKYMMDMLERYTPTRDLRSGKADLLVVPPTKDTTATYHAKAFSVSAPTLWNSLSSDLRKCQSLTEFKKLLKTFLFRRAYFTTK